MRVQCRRHRVGADGELSGHAEMNDQVKSLRRGAADGLRRAIFLEEEYEELAAAADLNNAATWGVLFDCRGIVDKIRLAQANAEYAAAREQQLQAADDSFDFGKLRQVSLNKKNKMQSSSRRDAARCANGSRANMVSTDSSDGFGDLQGLKPLDIWNLRSEPFVPQDKLKLRPPKNQPTNF